jgi:serine/threonine protein kinase
MEFVDGEPLNRILFREKRLGVRKACEIVLQVAEALHYIHRQNVVHCDIKTENILIAEEEIEGKRTRMVAKLLDVGLARLAFDACRLPLALLAPNGTIVAANPAFAKFVMGVSVEVEGLPVRSTPLASAWASAEQDIARTLSGNPIRRIIEIDVAQHETRRLLLWLDAVSGGHVVLGVQPLEL